MPVGHLCAIIASAMKEKMMGELIREARLKKGLSREELAVRIGCSYFTLRKWEKGEAVPIRMFRKRLEEELGIELSGK